MVTEQAIRDLVSRTAAEFRPERIILFGSRATGNARPDSDVDLLVVLPFSGASLDKSVEILGRVHPGVFALDLLARTPEEVAWRYEGGDPLMREAIDHGVVLHEAAA